MGRAGGRSAGGRPAHHGRSHGHHAVGHRHRHGGNHTARRVKHGRVVGLHGGARAKALRNRRRIHARHYRSRVRGWRRTRRFAFLYGNWTTLIGRRGGCSRSTSCAWDPELSHYRSQSHAIRYRNTHQTTTVESNNGVPPPPPPVDGEAPPSWQQVQTPEQQQAQQDVDTSDIPPGYQEQPDDAPPDYNNLFSFQCALTFDSNIPVEAPVFSVKGAKQNTINCRINPAVTVATFLEMCEDMQAPQVPSGQLLTFSCVHTSTTMASRVQSGHLPFGTWNIPNGELVDIEGILEPIDDALEQEAAGGGCCTVM